MKKNFMIAVCVSFSMIAAGCCGNNSNSGGAANDTEAPAAVASQPGAIKIITAQKFIKPEMVEEYIEFTRELIEKSNAEEGCISYKLYQNPHDPTRFLFFEEWKDQAAIDYHFSTDHFKMAGEKGGDFDAKPSILKIFDAVPSK